MRAFCFILFCSFFVFFIGLPGAAQELDQEWQAIMDRKRGTLKVFWFESRPFIFKTSNNKLAGIEYELIGDFSRFLQQKYGVQLTVDWIEAASFYATMDSVVTSSAAFGTSAFSITDEREKIVEFSPSYMSDIMVMVSSGNVPDTRQAENFIQHFSSLKAVTIKGTTYERELLYLREKFHVPFKVQYINTVINVLDEIKKKDDAFGFVDLPIYLMYLKENPAINVKRQDFYPIKKKGYGFLISKGSGWRIPVQEFFSQQDFKRNLEGMIGNYLDIELYKLNERVAEESNRESLILSKEREIQKNDLLLKEAEIERRTKANYLLTSLVVVAAGLLVVIILQNLKVRSKNDAIKDQQSKIEEKNAQLEVRNENLHSINEEKNNLIKILAHDMRSPLNQIHGLSQLMTSGGALSEEQLFLIQNIQDATLRLSRMISNILDVDAIESHRINLVMEPLGVEALVAKIVTAFIPQATAKNIRLVFNSSNLLPAIVADSLYLTQVVENLVSNAIKFSPPSTEVTVMVGLFSNKVRIGIKDQGPGLTESDQKLLFRKFQRLSNRPTNGEASIGLGLSIVKKYTEAMGGKVWCESEPGMGAAFNLEFNAVIG